MGKKRVKMSTAMLLIVVLLFGATPAFATGNLWYDKYVTYETANGNKYIASNDSGSLAWGESYLLDSYLNMYGLTKSTSWLDKFTTHVDSVISNASDPDGDGYLDWRTFRYSKHRTQNGTFAAATTGDATLPNNWLRFQSTSSTAYRSNASGSYYPSGSVCGGDTYGAVLKTNGTSWQSLYQNLDGYEPNSLYTLSLLAKTNGSAAKGRAYILDATTSTIIASIVIDDTSWKDYKIDFTTPVAGHTLQVWIGHNAYNVANGIAYFDNVYVNANVPYLVHDGAVGIPMAKFVRLVDENALTGYQTDANNYQSFIEDHLIPKWQTSSSFMGNTWVNVSATEGYYRESYNFDGFNTTVNLDPLPYNQFLVFAEMMMIMYDVNGNSDYLDKAKKMSTYFKNDLTVGGTAYNWNYAAYSPTAVEDASHANIDISVAFEMFNHGQVFTGTDMEKFTDTYTDIMWNQSLSDPKVHNYVNGTQGSACQDWLYTLDIHSWTRLAQFNENAWKIAAYQYDGLTPTRHNEALVLTEIMKWDPQKVANNGFEFTTSSDSTLPARWSRGSGSTSGTVYVDTVNKSSGDHGLTVASTTSTSTWQMLYQDWKNWYANTSYQISFDAMTDGGAAGGRFFIKDITANVILGTGIIDFDNTSWQTRTMTFTSPSSATNTVRIYLENHSLNQNGKAHFDNVVIKRTGDTW